jgi:hypothetical protein
MKKEAYIATACDNVGRLLTAKEANLWPTRLDCPVSEWC